MKRTIVALMVLAVVLTPVLVIEPVRPEPWGRTVVASVFGVIPKW